MLGHGAGENAHIRNRSVAVHLNDTRRGVASVGQGVAEQFEERDAQAIEVGARVGAEVVELFGGAIFDGRHGGLGPGEGDAFVALARPKSMSLAVSVAVSHRVLWGLIS